MKIHARFGFKKAELFFYLLAAVAALGADLATFSLLIYSGVNAYWSQGIARIFGGVTSFIINRNFSFSGSSKGMSTQARRFLFQYVLAYGLSLFLLWVFHSRLNLSLPIAKPLTDFMCFVFNFVCMKFYTYSSFDGLLSYSQGLYRRAVEK